MSKVEQVVNVEAVEAVEFFALLGENQT